MKGAREVQLQRCRNDIGNHCPYTAPFMQPPTFLMWSYCWRAFLPPYYIGSHGMNDTHCPAIICTENCLKTSNINCFSSHPRQHTRCSAYLSRAVAALPASMLRVLCSSASIFSCTAHRWHPGGQAVVVRAHRPDSHADVPCCNAFHRRHCNPSPSEPAACLRLHVSLTRCCCVSLASAWGSASSAQAWKRSASAARPSRACTAPRFHAVVTSQPTSCESEEDMFGGGVWWDAAGLPLATDC